MFFNYKYSQYLKIMKEKAANVRIQMLLCFSIKELRLM